MSTPRAKEKLEHHFLWSVSALSFQPLLIVNTQAQPFPGGDRACWDSPGLCPESAPLDNPSCSHRSWSSVFLQPAPISPPSTHIQPLQYHIQSQSCHSALRGLNLGSSNSFPAPTFTTAQHCSAALHAVFLGTAEKSEFIWGHQEQGPTGARVSSAVISSNLSGLSVMVFELHKTPENAQRMGKKKS